MEKKKVRKIVGVGIVAAIFLVIGVVWFFNGNFHGGNQDKVYVEQVQNLISNQFGAVSRYSGKVESQETWEIKKDMDKTISEMLVSVGDEVEEGTPLFIYDTRDLSSRLDLAYLELEGINNAIANYEEQIESLEEEMKNASSDKEKSQYNISLSELKIQLVQEENNYDQKKYEIEGYQKSINQSTVTSKVTGIVKDVNESGYDNYGSEKACVTILANGDFRVKGTLDEQSLYYGGIAVGQKVIIRSRVDEDKTWAGEIALIDTQQEAGNNDPYGYSNGESTSKYPFYVTLENSTDLILGQHVFIEPDFGQSQAKEGIWLDASYIVMTEDETYVWVANSKNRIEKRMVELGEFDETLYRYQILSGLTEQDYIAWPLAGMYEGIKTVTDPSEIDENSPLYQQGSEDISPDVPGIEELPDISDMPLPEEAVTE